MTSKHPEGFYCRYLRQLGERRRAAGEVVPDVVDDPQYWRERARLHAEQNKHEHLFARRISRTSWTEMRKPKDKQ